MSFVSTWIEVKHSRVEMDYVVFGHWGAGIYFSKEFTSSGYDPFLDSLASPIVSDPASQFIDSIREYLIDERETEILALHFGDMLKVAKVLELRAIEGGQERDLANLKSFKYGFRLALTEFQDCYRIFFDSFEPIRSQWLEQRKLLGITAGKWDPFDTEYEFQVLDLKKNCFHLPVARFQDFIEFFTTPLLSGSGTVLSALGEGFLLEYNEQTKGSEIGEIERFSVWNKDDWLRDDEVCIHLSDAPCEKSHAHNDSVVEISLLINAEEFASFF